MKKSPATKFIAWKQRNKLVNGKMKVVIPIGNVITQLKYDRLSENDKEFYHPIGLDDLIAEIQGKTIKGPVEVVLQPMNNFDFSSYSNVLPAWMANQLTK